MVIATVVAKCQIDGDGKLAVYQYLQQAETSWNSTVITAPFSCVIYFNKHKWETREFRIYSGFEDTPSVDGRH